MSKLSPEQLKYYRDYYKKNRTVILEKMRLWRIKNKDRLSRKRKARYWSDESYREQISLHRAELYRKIRYEVLSHYSKGEPICNCCNITDLDVLCIDHILGGGKKHRKETNLWGAKLCWYLKRNNFPKGFQVLCANCNLKKRINEEG